MTLGLGGPEPGSEGIGNSAVVLFENQMNQISFFYSFPFTFLFLSSSLSLLEKIKWGKGL